MSGRCCRQVHKYKEHSGEAMIAYHTRKFTEMRITKKHRTQTLPTFLLYQYFHDANYAEIGKELHNMKYANHTKIRGKQIVFYEAGDHSYK